MSRNEISLEDVCNAILNKEIISCGVEDDDFFIEFNDGSCLFFWSDEDLNMSYYKDKRGLQ